MSTASTPAVDVAAYRALQSEPMRTSALFGHLAAFEVPRLRDLPGHLDPARAPIRAVKAERLRVTVAAAVAAGLAWALAVLVLGIAITRDPGPILGFAMASTPVFTLGMGAFAWFMNTGVIIPVEPGRLAVWQTALEDAGFEESSWTTSTKGDQEVGIYRPQRGIGRVFLFDTENEIAFLSGPLGRMAPLTKRLLEAQAGGAA